MAAITSAQDGIWSDTDTWTGGVVPGEGDTVIIQNTHDVELDELAFDSTGELIVGADSATAAIQVNSGGKLYVDDGIGGSGVGGDFILICKGDFKTDGTGGTIEIGTAANPIPVETTFTVKLNYSASLSDGEYGLLIAAGGTFTCQGVNPWGTAITDPDRCLLATDEAVNSTSLTVDSSTEWNDGDYIAIAPTGTTYSQYEIGQMNGDAVGTTLTVDGFGGVAGGLAYAHTGTDADVRAEIINLTRNVVIMNYDGVIGTPGAVSYVSFATTAVVDVDWTEFRYMGENAAGKYGVVINTTTGSCNLNRCSFHHFEDGGIDIVGTTANNFTVQNCVGYRLSDSFNRGALRIINTTQSTWTINNIWLIGCSTDGNTVWIYSTLGTTSNLRVAGTRGTGFVFYTKGAYSGGTLTNLYAHSINGYGFGLQGYNFTVTGAKAWHNSSAGININLCQFVTFNSAELYGNVSSNIIVNNGSTDIVFNNLKSSGTTTQATSYGFAANDLSARIIFNSPQFSYAAGSRVVHSTSDIALQRYVSVYLNNPKFGSSGSYIRFLVSDDALNAVVYCQKYNQSAGDHRTYINHLYSANNGSIIQTDTAYYHTAAPSCKITPTSATVKLGSGVMQIPVASGANPTVSVYLRKSAAYNGSQPRLIVKRNDALGITADTVMGTFASAVDADVAPGTFTALSGQPGAVTADGVIEVYVDCDGTAGYVNICNWKVKGAQSPTDNLDAYWNWGLPYDGLTSRIKSPFTPFGA